jgi:hypothetical protein
MNMNNVSQFDFIAFIQALNALFFVKVIFFLAIIGYLIFYVCYF